MTAYDEQYDREIAELEARFAAVQAMTDEDVRAAGYKESTQYPGYFINDPRHPNFSAEERYLMDHPGPDWRTKPRLTPNKTVWDDEQFAGQDIVTWDVPPVTPPKIIPVRSGNAEAILREATPDQVIGYGTEATKRVMGLWVCRVCRKSFALWPRERAWRFETWGIRAAFVLRSPIACLTCRLWHAPTVARLAHATEHPVQVWLVRVHDGGPWMLLPRGMRVKVYRAKRLLSRLRAKFGGLR